MDAHFTPSYRPWRQRIAFVPDGDLFKGIRSRKASVVTAEISFTKKGILRNRRSSGRRDRDGDQLHLNVLGDIAFSSAASRSTSQTVTYRGMMFTGVPNMAWVFGYFRASWTLRADLVGDFVCRLLKHMGDKQARRVEVALRPEDKDMKLLPWIDPENFNPGYLMRSMHLLPRRGDKREWQHTQDYWREKNECRPSTRRQGLAWLKRDPRPAAGARVQCRASLVAPPCARSSRRNSAARAP